MLELLSSRLELIPEGATVNKHRYEEILRRLRNSVRRKRSELWRRMNLLVLHNTGPASVQEGWRNKRSPFCHDLHTQLVSHHATWTSISVGDKIVTASREPSYLWQTGTAATCDYNLLREAGPMACSFSLPSVRRSSPCHFSLNLLLPLFGKGT
jgi:hypothetical protein